MDAILNDLDGALMDVYVLGTDMDAWQRMLDGLWSAGYDMRYSVGMEPAELPQHVEDAFVWSMEDERGTLSVQLSEMQANCHFFIAEEIEFDLDPRQFKRQSQLDTVLTFLKCVAQSVGSEARLCPENMSDNLLVVVRPDGSVEDLTCKPEGSR